MPPKAPAGKEAKVQKINMAVELKADVDMKRLYAAYEKFTDKAPEGTVTSHMDPLKPFFHRIKQEIALVKENEQLDIPRIPLFITVPIDFNAMKITFSILVHYPWLRQIQLYHSKIGDDGAMVIADYLHEYKPPAAKNPFGIEVLELPQCDIGPKGALLLGRMLAQNETIKLLNLDFNPLGDEGAANLGEGLKWNSTLEKLTLKYCNIGALGGECAGKFIVRSSAVKDLSLRGNPLGPTGVAHVGEALAKNAYLLQLDLADTGFGVDLEAIEALRDGIESNDSLEAIDINLNSLVPAGMQLLLELVRAKPKITRFDVYERIGEQAFKDMLDAVAENVKLQKKKKKKA